MITFAHAGQERIDPRLMSALEAVGVPLTVTSGYRSPEYNRAIGGAQQSMHTHGLAADIDLTGMDDAARGALLDAMAAAGLSRFGMYSKSPNMMHVDMSLAQGPRHFMFDRSVSNIDRAPEWFRARHYGRTPQTTPASSPETPGMIPRIPNIPASPAQASPSTPAERSFLTELTVDPLFNIGMSLLAAGTSGQDLGTALQAGMTGALRNQLLMDAIAEKREERDYDRRSAAAAAQWERDKFERMRTWEQSKLESQQALEREKIAGKVPEIYRIAQRMFPGDLAKQNEFVTKVKTKPLVSMPGTPGFDQQMLLDEAKSNMEFYRGRAQTAGDSLMKARQGLDLLKEVKTGPWQPQVAALSRLTGVSPEIVSGAEIFESFAGEFVMNQLSAMGGATSDAEMAFARTIGPDLGKTPFANYYILRLMETAADRQQRMPIHYQEYLRKRNAGDDSVKDKNGNVMPYEKYFLENYGGPELNLRDMRVEFLMRRGATREDAEAAADRAAGRR